MDCAKKRGRPVGSPAPWKRTWTDEEVSLLLEAYASWPPRYDLLPERPRNQIHRKAYTLGLTGRDRLAPLFEHVTPTQWAYLAGIMDGEGTIAWYPQARGTKRCMSFANTDKALVDWAVDVFGNCNIWEEDRPTKRPGWKYIYQVRWTSAHVMEQLLEGLIPFLIVKRAPAVELLEQIKVYRSRKRSSKRGDEVHMYESTIPALT